MGKELQSSDTLASRPCRIPGSAEQTAAEQISGPRSPQRNSVRIILKTQTKREFDIRKFDVKL